jgi:excisionase family DNA binding protein
MAVSSQREKLLTPDELARWLGVSSAWVRDHATRKQPQLPTVRLGKLMRFRAEEIDRFLKEQEIRQAQ